MANLAGEGVRLFAGGTEAGRFSQGSALCFTNRPLAPGEKLILTLGETPCPGSRLPVRTVEGAQPIRHRWLAFGESYIPRHAIEFTTA